MFTKLPFTLLLGAAALAQPPRAPVFEFDVWTRPPSREVYKLTAETATQRMLRAVRDEALPSHEIAARAGTPETEVEDRMRTLAKFGLAGSSGGKWLSNIPLYEEADLREAEKIGLPFAEKEAAILAEAMPHVRAVYEKTAPAHTFPWEKVSLIIVGGLLADFCVIDRIPFRAGAELEQFQPPLRDANGRRWGYTGYEKLPARFVSSRWKFSHNLGQSGEGGIARFHLSTEQGRESPARTESWAVSIEGRILFALAAGPLAAPELKLSSGLREEAFAKALAMLRGTNPPAVVEQAGKFHLRIPVFTEADLAMLLREFDRVAERIVREVSRPHYAACEKRGKELGQRFPLPYETFARDKALQILVDRGLLAAPAVSPVPWNAGVWGWQGLLAQHSDVTEQITAEPFLKTAVSAEERREIAAFEEARAGVLGGRAFQDQSTPWRAWLTRLANHPRRTPEMVRGDTLVRVLPVPAAPKDGDLAALFIRTAEEEDEALILVGWRGNWHYIGNSARPRYWRSGLAPFVKSRIAQLEAQTK